MQLECDEMRCFEPVEKWSFVESKQNKQWIWRAQDVENRQIAVLRACREVGQFVGKRDYTGASGLLVLSKVEVWNSLPPVYRQCAVCYTDAWKAYTQVLPSKRHRAEMKNRGKTNHASTRSAQVLKDLTTHYDRDFHVWVEKLFLSPKNSKIMLELFGFLSFIIINHYFRNTTKF